jgi:hypothetical protein
MGGTNLNTNTKLIVHKGLLEMLFEGCVRPCSTLQDGWDGTIGVPLDYIPKSRSVTQT